MYMFRIRDLRTDSLPTPLLLKKRYYLNPCHSDQSSYGVVISHSLAVYADCA